MFRKNGTNRVDQEDFAACHKCPGCVKFCKLTEWIHGNGFWPDWQEIEAIDVEKLGV